jgi:UPF0755 protein
VFEPQQPLAEPPPAEEELEIPPAAVVYDPTPVEPAAVEPAPVEPAPVEPAPVEPAPVETVPAPPPLKDTAAPWDPPPAPLPAAAPPELAQPPQPTHAPAPAPAQGRAAAAPPPPRADIPRRARPRRSPPARLAAVAALVAALAAVFLLFRSLLGTRHSKAVTPPAVVRVLIPEGETRVQIARLAAADGLEGSYLAAAGRSALLNPAHYGAARGTPDLEGFLFPATYEMSPHAPVSRLLNEQLAAFKENFGAAEMSRARGLHVTPYQLLTIASMIEREAQVPGDRPKIAAVIYNRLRRGMPLGIDATIYYAVELRDGIATYTHELTEAQLHIDSPYNTRTHTGLPPTPISNPGLASINAAANPAHVSYLYYVAAADGCGKQLFSRTLAKFEADAAAYQAAVKHNGGRLPACKKK